MLSQGNAWSLILAAGSGVRLRNLTTTPSGTVIPKQFCCLRGGPSLLDHALERARVVSADRNTCAIVAEQHRRWWEPELWRLPPANVIVQPENRGTANGILLPLLQILERDPAARLVVLPSDHFVRQESILARSLRHALELLRSRFDRTVLLGLQPEFADPGLGYILPGRADDRDALEVLQFIEKPMAAQAHELIERGGLWNAFIVVTSAEALLALFQRRVPETVREMSAALRADLSAQTDGRAVAELYDRLPDIDFSRDILQGQESWLRAVAVPHCGWSDLGTPERVSEALRRLPATETKAAWSMSSGNMSLAARSELLNRASSLTARDAH